MSLKPNPSPQTPKLKSRIDLLMVERALAPSRQRAQSLILAGKVLVDDCPVTKAGTVVSKKSTIRLREKDHPYVSRGGLKLERALKNFRVSCRDRRALDIGASTGGFTDVLLQFGAREVTAVDVGRGILDWKLRTDPRVHVREGVNARYLVRDEGERPYDIITVDVSFISLEKIIPPLLAFGGRETDWITLIKPQFEAGRENVGKGGIVRSEEVRQQVVARVTKALESHSLKRIGLIESPIDGADGNKEFLAHWRVVSSS